MKGKMTKAELLAIEHRPWHEEIDDVRGVYVIPSNRKHDSGFYCMDFVAEKRDGTLIRFGGGCDDVRFDGGHFRMDCCPHTHCLHIWNSRYPFVISDDVSSIDFTEYVPGTV